MQKRIFLDVGLLRSKLDYNPHTGEIKTKTRIGNIASGVLLGRKNSYGYLKFQINGSEVFSHRVAFAIFHGYAPDFIDHVNGDRSDNRIANLREADANKNARNSFGKAYRKSSFKGVSFHKKNKKWQVQIRNGGKLISLGYCSNEAEAAYIYDIASLNLHGEYGKRNFLPLVF